MAAKKTEGRSETVPITMRVPSQFVERAEQVAKLISTSGFEASPTDAMRAAMEKGFEAIAQESSPFYVSAWDGARTTCLYAIAYSKKDAIARAEDLARQHAGGKWTVFRVFEQGHRPRESLYQALVKDGGKMGGE